ncbi:MAG: 3-deoxy-D-manno-octulosonic acid kinase [Pseudomonadota bacterium]
MSGRVQILCNARVYREAPEYLFDAAAWPRHAGSAGAGRGTTAFVGDDTGDYALRHYRRGGFVANLSEDRYIFISAERSRAFREYQLLTQLLAAGLPVPEPIAARCWRHGLTYTADLVTRRVPDTLTLAAALKEAPLEADAWRGLGQVIGRFHEAGACHADLNAHNILTDSAGRWYLIDFDRGRLRRDGAWRAGNLARLQRSLAKLAPVAGAAGWPELQRGYSASSRKPA